MHLDFKWEDTVRLLTSWYKKHARTIYIRSLRRTDCSAGHYAIAKNGRERLPISKRQMRNYHISRFHLKKLNSFGDNEEY